MGGIPHAHWDASCEPLRIILSNEENPHLHSCHVRYLNCSFEIKEELLNHSVYHHHHLLKKIKGKKERGRQKRRRELESNLSLITQRLR